MPQIEEGRLIFDFPAGWEVVRYDQDADIEAGVEVGFYRRVVINGNEEAELPALQRIRGIDFVARAADAAPRVQFIEVKDDDLNTEERQARHKVLYETVLLKTFNSLSGVLLAERLREPSLAPMACLSLHPVVEVVLFLVEPPVAQVSAIGSKRKLRRQNRAVKRNGIDQQLAAKLAEWHLPFYLYNLTTRLPPHWQVRIKPTAPTSAV